MAKRVIGKHKAFLKAFAACGSITKAAKAAKMDRGDHYEWMKKDPAYAEAFAAAVEQAASMLEDEAVRRAHEGIFEPNVYQGQFTYPLKGFEINPETGKPDISKPIYGKKPLGVIKYSDSLLQFLLKGLKPERYRDRVSAEVTGKDGGPISLEAQRLQTLTDDELTQLLATAQKLALAGNDGSGAPSTEKK